MTILPITAPYVAHHGALGPIAYLYLADAESEAVADLLKQQEGI